MKVNYNGESYDVKFSCYENENVAIILNDEDDGQLATVASVNGDIITDGTYVGIKDWSENEGIAHALIDAGIVTDEIVTEEPSGFVWIPYLRLTDEALAEVNEAKRRLGI